MVDHNIIYLQTGKKTGQRMAEIKRTAHTTGKALREGIVTYTDGHIAAKALAILNGNNAFYPFIVLRQLIQHYTGFGGHAHLLSRNEGTLANILREKGNKILGNREHETIENQFRAQRDMVIF